MRNAWLAAALALGFLLTGCKAPPPPPPPAPLWPTLGWPSATPESQGLDSNSLAYAIETIRARHLPVHSIFVERNGYTVLDAYFFPFQSDETHDLASVTKSVVSTLIGVAERDGRLGSVNQPVTALLPAEHFGSDPGKNRITLANLLSMTSGLDCRAPAGVNLLRQMEQSPDWVAFTWNLPQTWAPGTTFEYCGGSLHIISAVLTAQTGENALALAQQELFAPLGITQAFWAADLYGNSRGFADLELHPRDAAKLGLLWLHRGQWGESQIVPAAYLQDALSPHATVQPGIEYGYAFWLYPSHNPYDFEANGHGGQRITVIPSENMVTVVTAGGADANLIAPLLAAAYRRDSPLPANPAGDARLAAAILDATRPPPAANPLPIPAWAAAISGTTYAVGENPLGLRTVRLSFPGPGEGSVQFGYASGASREYAIGLDGVPRLTFDASARHRVAVTGYWRTNGFDLDYNTVARIEDYWLHIAPTPTGLSIGLTDRNGPVDATLTAIPQQQSLPRAPTPPE